MRRRQFQSSRMTHEHPSDVSLLSRTRAARLIGGILINEARAACCKHGSRLQVEQLIKRLRSRNLNLQNVEVRALLMNTMGK